MSIYIIPASGNPADLLEAATRARVPVLQVKTVREYILGTHEVPMAIGVVPTEVLLVLNRHASTLLLELPSAVFAVPGLIYDSGWNTYATAYPAVDASELMAKLSKSGRLANTPDELERQNEGSVPPGPRATLTRGPGSGSQGRSDTRLSFPSAHSVNPGDEDEVDADDMEP